MELGWEVSIRTRTDGQLMPPLHNSLKEKNDVRTTA
jgi:hypothetical protein